MIRTTGKRMLSAAGYGVTLADSGASALDAYRNNTQDIDLVLLDLSASRARGVLNPPVGRKKPALAPKGVLLRSVLDIWAFMWHNQVN